MPETGGGYSGGSTDPRLTITPESFAIAPELLGLPLAEPWRRAMAMLLDLAIVAVLTRLSGVLLALGAAFALWRASAERSGGGFVRGWMRFWMRAAAGLVALIALLVTFTSLTSRIKHALGSRVDAVAASDTAGTVMGLPGLMATVVEVRQLQRAKSPQEARILADQIVARLERSGVPRDSLAQAARELAANPSVSRHMPAYSLRALNRALGADTATFAAAPPPDVDVARAYTAALARHDSAGADSLGRRLAASVAGDTIAELNSRLSAAQGRYARLEKASAKKADQGSGVTGLIRQLADDLGLSVGWIGLYFTAFLALWRGQTPGKRMLGIRVLRLDGERIGWWAAFERFGGYAAGFVTGLMGFAQVIWDRNRQATHDKICETVVVRDTPHARAVARALATGPAPGHGGTGSSGGTGGTGGRR